MGSRLDQSVLPHCKPWHTAPTTSSLVDALAVISEHRLQALPLVDASNVLHDVISCRDVRVFASQATHCRHEHCPARCACLPTLRIVATGAHERPDRAGRREPALPGAHAGTPRARRPRPAPTLITGLHRAHPHAQVRLFTCCPTDTFAVALQRLANSDVPQLVCVDENRHVCGVITAADILAALLAAGAAPAA